MTRAKDIRNSTALLLETADLRLTVYNSKILPTQIKDLPSAVVFIGGQSLTKPEGRLNALLNSITLHIVVVVSGGSDTWADNADDAVESVIDALTSSKSWGAQWNNLAGYSVDYAMEAEGERLLGMAKITFNGTIFRTFTPT